MQYAVVTKLIYSLIAMALFVVLSDTVSTEDCWGEYMFIVFVIVHTSVTCNPIYNLAILEQYVSNEIL